MKADASMIPRPDLLDGRSPSGLEVFQLTSEPGVPACHVYMEAQVFTPDSKRFLLHRSATDHGGDKNDPRHRYLLCDLEDNGRLTPVTDETGATAPSVSPDGRCFYYFVDQTEPGGGRLTLRRRALAGGPPETLLVVDAPLPGTSFRPSRIYPLSTISSDGERIALSCFLGDGRTPGSPFGLMVFDLPAATVRLILHGVSWCNMHPQYSRSRDPLQARDILIQENHGNVCDAQGRLVKAHNRINCDIHVVRDDGMHFRNLPWGRDGKEFCQGHQCWRGRSDWVITSTVDNRMIEGRPVAHVDHHGLASPGGQRNELTREIEHPEFAHFGTDIEGRRLVVDTGQTWHQGALYLAGLGEPGRDPFRNFTYLLKLLNNNIHAHPFLSPDGRMAFFNFDESGLPQAYLLRGLPAV